MHTHIVFFWLHETANERVRESLRDDCHTLLGNIGAVKDLRVGVPADTHRDIVERTYDLAIVVTFDDLAGCNTYQNHPKHSEFVKKHAEYFKKCLVYDIAS